MNINKIKVLAAIIPGLALLSCSENDWNDKYLEGFVGGPSYSNSSTGSATLTADDYSTISSLMLAQSKNSVDSAAARAIKNNMYFDATSPFPGSVAIPYYIASTSSPFFNFANGSTVEIAYKEISGTPEEISKISAASTYTLTSADYKMVWDNETDYISAFSPSHTAEKFVPEILKEKFPEAEEGEYAIVTYNQTSENPTFNVSGGGSATELTNSIKNLSVGDNLSATAVVTGQCSRGLILTDNGGSILYYNPSVDLTAYPIGTIVKVSGSVSAYNQGLQLSDSASIDIVGSEVYSYPSPVVYDASMIDSACATEGDFQATYVKVDGTLSISGNYYNIFIEGASAQGSVYYVTDDIKSKLVDGEEYSFYGYFVAVSGSSTKYFNILLTDVGPIGGSPVSGLTDSLKNLSVGESVSATAVVTGQCAQGLILTDNGGSVFYYNKNVDLSAYPIGTIVKVSGELSAYNFGLQLTDSASIEIAGNESYSYPTPIAYSASMVDEACGTTENFQATYVSIQGVLSISGNYYNIIIDGADAQGSVYYATDALKEVLQDGVDYTYYGYFMAVSGSGKYFNILVTDAVPVASAANYFGGIATRDVSFSPVSAVENKVYYFNGSSWSVATDVAALNPADYAAMGDADNSITSASVKIPMYLKANYPYAVEGDQVFVAYDIQSNGCSCNLFVYDGMNWNLNDNGMEDLIGQFAKANDSWRFVKYVGKAIFTIFEEDEIILDRTYMIVYGTAAATPVPSSSSYGYLLKTDVSPEDGVIVLNNDANGFTFATTCTYNGTEYKTPAGKFIIRDSNGRYLYLQGTYASFNVRADSPYIEDGVIGDGYLFSATNNGDGTWTITNDRGEGSVRNIYFSIQYSNFAAYTSAGDNDFLPSLYLLEE